MKYMPIIIFYFLTLSFNKKHIFINEKYNYETIKDTIIFPMKTSHKSKREESLLLKKLKKKFPENLFICFEKTQRKDYTLFSKYEYVYNFDNNTSNNVILIYKEYSDFDAKINMNKSLFLKINKSFFKKNKDIFINSNIINKLGRDEFIDLLNHVGKVFLIDKSMVKEKKITIMEMSYLYQSIE